MCGERGSRWVLASALAATMAVTALAQQPRPDPQLPIQIFRTPEDTRKTGVKPGDIKAGVEPDYVSLRSQVVTIPVRKQVHMIGGAGANIAVQVGADGMFLVDTGTAESAEKVVAAYQAMATGPLRYIVNTNADLDHTGGNEVVGRTGVGGRTGPGPGGGQRQSAPIIAFERVLEQMSAPTGTQASRAVEAWPTNTFFTPKKALYYNDEAIEILHQPAAYSDGDVMVHFRASDVLVTGDVFNTDRYPQFDAARGGTSQGIIDGLNRIIDVTVPAFNQMGGTLVIPGHGRIGNESDVVEVRDMATIIRARVKDMVERRMTLAQIKAAQPTLDYDGVYGANAGSWTTDMFLNALYTELAAGPSTTAGSRR